MVPPPTGSRVSPTAVARRLGRCPAPGKDLAPKPTAAGAQPWAAESRGKGCGAREAPTVPPQGHCRPLPDPHAGAPAAWGGGLPGGAPHQPSGAAGAQHWGGRGGGGRSRGGGSEAGAGGGGQGRSRGGRDWGAAAGAAAQPHQEAREEFPGGANPRAASCAAPHRGILAHPQLAPRRMGPAAHAGPAPGPEAARVGGFPGGLWLARPQGPGPHGHLPAAPGASAGTPGACESTSSARLPADHSWTQPPPAQAHAPHLAGGGSHGAEGCGLHP